jgi:hypothetical protein
VIKKYYANCIDQDDLISVGTIGLIKAINTFNIGKGARLATYAARCIDNTTTAVRPQAAKKSELGLLFRTKSSLLAAQRRRGSIASIPPPICLTRQRTSCVIIAI